MPSRDASCERQAIPMPPYCDMLERRVRQIQVYPCEKKATHKPHLLTARTVAGQQDSQKTRKWAELTGHIRWTPPTAI